MTDVTPPATSSTASATLTTTSPAPPLPIPWPPNWTSPQWWAVVITTIVTQVATFIALFHPGFHISTTAQTAIPSVAEFAAVGAWVYMLYVHKEMAKTAATLRG